MTPRRLDVDVVNEKLAGIDRALALLADLGDVSRDRLERDGIVEAAVERLICRVVELAVDVNAHVASAVLARTPSDYRTTFDYVVEAGGLEPPLAEALKGSVGLRNAIVHEYVHLDLDKVAAGVPLTLEHYPTYLAQIARFVTERE